MKPQKIAIIGAGTAGLAAAAFLKQDGHDVTIFEKFAAPKPLGAGLLLQPTGLAVLSLLGLDQRVIQQGSVINQLHGCVAGKTRATIDVRYRHFVPHLHGLGVQRGHLFDALFDKVTALNIPVRASRDISEITQSADKARLTGQEDDYDLVIDASGAKSALRTKYADVKLDRPYPFGAVWAIVNLPPRWREVDTLEQRFKRAYNMIGILPVGGGKAAFFWSLKTADYPRWREQPLSEWKAYVESLWPQTAFMLEQFRSHDDLMQASYRDVILRRYHAGRILFIGDSAHCTSPQLGQGANLALVDALVLSQCLREHDAMSDALDAYSNRRRAHLRFYQMASRWLTPFFQSDSLLFAKLRFFTCDITAKIPLTQRIAAQVLSGTKTGVFSTLNPGDWAKAYELYPKISAPPLRGSG